MNFIFLLLVIILAINLIVILNIWKGMHKILNIGDIPPHESIPQPMVSIIIPAQNEAEFIEQSLSSVLSLDYDNLQVIVVNDRSTDHTRQILEKMQLDNDRLQVLHIDELPDGWIGKNHALMKGSEIANGEYLLFTDADIHFEKSTLKRVIHHVLDKKLDHLSMLFEIKVKSGLLAAMMIEAGGIFLLKFKPWEAKNPSGNHYIGIGAFNIVSSFAYQQIGTHRSISMAPLDDIMLGKCIKQKGFRQECLTGYGYVAVEWYRSVPEMIKGLQKNIFAAFNYNLALVSVSTIILAIIGLLPQFIFLATTGPNRLLSALLILLRLLSFAYGARKNRFPMHYAIWSLISPLAAIYTIWHATLTTLFHNGITWRNTFYPLSEIKKYKL
jgi:glycosyltransferase involved in cell wall biosynthesis